MTCAESDTGDPTTLESMDTDTVMESGCWEVSAAPEEAPGEESALASPPPPTLAVESAAPP